MTDLKKYFGESGIVLDPSMVFTGEGKTSDDLLKEMNENGLQVSHLESTGELVRVPVTASSQTRPDKHNEKSGWYVVYQTSDAIFAAYGNWRTGIDYKFSSVSPNKMTSQDKQRLQREIKDAVERSKQERAKRYEEVSQDCKQRLQHAQKIKDHSYLEKKKIKSYGLKQINKSIVVPITDSTTGELRSLQYINKEKRFVSASEVKGNIYYLGFDLADIASQKKIIITEGMATAHSCHEATELPTVCVFSANFGKTALDKLRKQTNAKFILAFDNDEHGLGKQKAEEIAAAIPNCNVRIPSAPGDFNDLAQEDLNLVIKLLLQGGFNFANYSIGLYKGEPPPRDWLVENFIENKAGVFSSVGGVGKSMLALDLSLKIAQGQGTWMGKTIRKSGQVVFFSAEDDQVEIHRRLKALNALGARETASNDVFVIPIPNLERPINLLAEDGSGLRITNQAYEISEELENIDNLALIVIDPISSFVGNVSGFTTNQEAGQLYGYYCSMLSSKFKCCVLSVHHMVKSSLAGFDDPMLARAAVKGSTSIIDSARFGLAAWLASETEAERICLEQGVEYDRMRVIKAGIVKTNSGEVDTRIKTLFRKDGLLEILDEKKGLISWD